MRRRRRQENEEAVRTERWLVSYADFMTLLFALFVVLFASSYRDSRAVQKVAAAVRHGFIEMGTFAPAANSGKPADFKNGAMQSAGGVDMEELNRKLNAVLGAEILRREVDTKMTPEGFVISLHEMGFFDSGQAQLKPGAADKVEKIASVVSQYGMDMRVEGHSDNVPIHNASFHSNWELSTARATAVAMLLINEAGADPARVSIAGYGQYRPAASNDTPQGRAANRRVDIVIVSPTKPHRIEPGSQSSK